MGLVTKTYITNSTTIVKDDNVNLGLNPILELNYNKLVSRFLIYFPHEKLQKLVEDKTYPDITKLKHTLKLYNSASDYTANKLNNNVCDFKYNTNRVRACSFDLIFFLLPNKFDSGRGFDFIQDLHHGNSRAYSECGVNWYQYRNGCEWGEEGVYSQQTLSSELEKFTNPTGNKSDIIIAYKTFNYGNENIELDITDIVNKYITGELSNNGIGIAFTPKFESIDDVDDYTYYVGFFSNNTLGFFEPFVETRYDSRINDVRQRVVIGNKNRLYFYSNIGGMLENLQKIPTCTINEKSYEVKQETKGVYYIESDFIEEGFEPNTMYYDVWSNIEYNGRKLKDVELSFTIADDNIYFNFSNQNSISDVKRFTPKLYGIQHLERIKRGDIRRIDLENKIEYTNTKVSHVDKIEYRLYVKIEQSEHDVIEWTEVEQGFNCNFFYINTNDLIPHRYFIDIRYHYGFEIIHHHKKLEFDIVNDTTDMLV